MSDPSSSTRAQLWTSKFDGYNEELQAAALNATKLAAGLPADMAFHRSVDNEYAQTMDACSSKALSLTNKLLSLISNAQSSTSRGKGKAKLQDQDDVVDRFDAVVVDAIDFMFEKVDTCLDEFLGNTTVPNIAVNPPVQTSSTRSKWAQGRLDPSLLHANDLAKPQLTFTRKPSNLGGPIWRPSLKHKYNSKVPLGYNPPTSSADDGAEQLLRTPHPYQYEVRNIAYPYSMFAHADPISPKSFEDTPFTWVDTKSTFDDMLEKLRAVKEVAIDLEHHSYRSFAGFVCLMQISTRNEDFIVDTLKLRSELEDLNEVFTDPQIVKVFHGAESDIIWLQQDFDIYVVNLFDTFHASKALAFPKHSLAALLGMYCDFVPDKRYQLADWRIRPLPSEMLHYARSDTHFLLYIYDNLRNALLDRAGGEPTLIRTVLDNSGTTALRLYEDEMYDYGMGLGMNGWETLAKKWNRPMSGLQMAVFKSVHAWRDRVSREEDESTRYVLPNHFLFKLAEYPPADLPAVLSTFRPIPPIVKQRAKELLEVIRDAVRENLTHQGVAMDAVVDHSVPVQPLVTVQVPMTLTEDGSTKQNLAKLWGAPREFGRPLTANVSTFLGETKPSLKSKTGIPGAAMRSVLFPTSVPSTKPALRPAKLARYKEVLTRIHSALMIAPTANMSLAHAEDFVTAPGQSFISQNDTEMTTEHSDPQPASQLSEPDGIIKLPTEDNDDDRLVVVGQRKTNKRKRDKKKQATIGDNKDVNEDTSTNKEGRDEIPQSISNKRRKREKKKDDDDNNATTANDDDGEVEEAKPFDYASAPNILDQGVAQAQAGLEPMKKQKKKGKGKGKKGEETVEYGSFPAPPKAHNQLKAGNVSHTFR